MRKYQLPKGKSQGIGKTWNIQDWWLGSTEILLIFSLSEYLSGAFYEPCSKAFAKEKWMDKEEYHVYERHVWSDVEWFYQYVTFPGSRGVDVGRKLWGWGCVGGWDGGGRTAPETIWREKRCGKDLKKNVTSVGKITQREDRLPESTGREYG